jgi:hypothetical protein
MLGEEALEVRSAEAFAQSGIHRLVRTRTW